MTTPVIADITDLVESDIGRRGLELRIPEEFPEPAHVDMTYRSGRGGWILYCVDRVPPGVHEPYSRVFELAGLEEEQIRELLLTVTDGPFEKIFLPTEIRQGESVVWSSTEDRIVNLGGSIDRSYALGRRITVDGASSPGGDHERVTLPGPPGTDGSNIWASQQQFPE